MTHFTAVACLALSSALGGPAAIGQPCLDWGCDMTKAPRKASKTKANVRLPKPALGLGDIFAALADQLDNSRWGADVDRAQEIAFDAMEAQTRAKRMALARKALTISPLCADAYAILAAETDDPEEALSLQRQAVEAGAKALGEMAFVEDVGNFWGLIETRPYMRARHSLAAILWARGMRDEAVEHYEDMLRLNPNDNQGIRYILVDALLELGRDDHAAALLKRYKDDPSASWAWSNALLDFRRKGDVAASRKALARAVKCNPHVRDYLLGRKALPTQLPEFIGMGDENEAVAYVSDSENAWRICEGAIEWVMATPAPLVPVENVELTSSAACERIDNAVLALLLLGLHDGDRAWKTFDWDVLGRLHSKGLISNPVGRTKSVMFTEDGLRLAKRLQVELFCDAPASEN